MSDRFICKCGHDLKGHWHLHPYDCEECACEAFELSHDDNESENSPFFMSDRQRSSGKTG